MATDLPEDKKTLEQRPRNTWINGGDTILVDSPHFSVIQRNCISSEDAEKKFPFYLFQTRDWCNIIPITEDGKIVMVNQFRIGVELHTLEIPGGVIDPEDKDYQTAAIREMEEETGYSALPGAKCIHLGWTYPNPALLNNKTHSFVIGPVKKSKDQNLDPGEMIEVIEVPIQDLPEHIQKGTINHALILNAFFLLALKDDEISSSLVRRLKEFSLF